LPGATPRGKIGAGSYEDPQEERRRKGRSKKTGRPRH
jgi:excinuclease ABC subunit B